MCSSTNHWSTAGFWRVSVSGGDLQKVMWLRSGGRWQPELPVWTRTTSHSLTVCQTQHCRAGGSCWDLRLQLWVFSYLHSCSSFVFILLWRLCGRHFFRFLSGFLWHLSSFILLFLQFIIFPHEIWRRWEAASALTHTNNRNCKMSERRTDKYSNLEAGDLHTIKSKEVTSCWISTLTDSFILLCCWRCSGFYRVSLIWFWSHSSVLPTESFYILSDKPHLITVK